MASGSSRGADSVKLLRSMKNSTKAAALLLESWAIDHMKAFPLPKVSYLSIANKLLTF